MALKGAKYQLQQEKTYGGVASSRIRPLTRLVKSKQGLIYSFGEEGMQLCNHRNFSVLLFLEHMPVLACARANLGYVAIFSNAEKFRCFYSHYGSCMPSSPKEYISPWSKVSPKKKINGKTRTMDRTMDQHGSPARCRRLNHGPRACYGCALDLHREGTRSSVGGQ